MSVVKVDGDTSTNDCVIALASGLSGSGKISSFDSCEAQQLQACLDAVSSLLFFLLCHHIYHFVKFIEVETDT